MSRIQNRCWVIWWNDEILIIPPPGMGYRIYHCQVNPPEYQYRIYYDICSVDSTGFILHLFYTAGQNESEGYIGCEKDFNSSFPRCARGSSPLTWRRVFVEDLPRQINGNGTVKNNSDFISWYFFFPESASRSCSLWCHSVMASRWTTMWCTSGEPLF